MQTCDVIVQLDQFGEVQVVFSDVQTAPLTGQ